jgi:hypothetical protein
VNGREQRLRSAIGDVLAIDPDEQLASVQRLIERGR